MITQSIALDDGRVRSELMRMERKIRELEIRLEQAVLLLEATGMSRGTTLPDYPDGPHLRLLNRQGIGGGDYAYLRMQKSTGDWGWFLNIKAT